MRMEHLALARALHVIGVVVWVGGVWLVTAALLPALRHLKQGADPLAVFHAVERRFVWQARIAVAVVGASGLYMVWAMEAWDRFTDIRFWWMHVMVLTWLAFAVILFVIEPLVANRHRRVHTAHDPHHALLVLQRGHWILLAILIFTIFAAVMGSLGALV